MRHIIYIQGDESVNWFVDHNGRLTDAARYGFDVVLGWSGQLPKCADRRSVGIIDSGANDKGRKVTDFIKALQSAGNVATVVRMCVDAVVMDWPMLRAMVDGLVSEYGDGNWLAGCRDDFPGERHWIRGGCNVWGWGLAKSVRLPIGVGPGGGIDWMFYKSAMASDATIIEAPMFEEGRRWSGRAPVWHPAKDAPPKELDVANKKLREAGYEVDG